MSRYSTYSLIIACFVVFLTTLGCTRPANPPARPWSISSSDNPSNENETIPTAVPIASTETIFEGPIYTPTPNPARELPALRTEPEQYMVQPGDTLGQIAQRYNVTVEDIAEANGLFNPNVLDVGQLLLIPVPTPDSLSPSFKIIPDSELVYSPSNATFDTESFVQSKDGFLAHHLEEVDGKTKTGVQIIELVARNYSVNPRLLLAVLEYQSDWVTDISPEEDTLYFPIGFYDPLKQGLYKQLAWVANNLNYGHYIWRVNGAAAWVLVDGTIVPISPTINAGTAGVQHLFSKLLNRDSWEKAVGESGLITTFSDFFGYPFRYSYEPLIPEGLTQPSLQLPFEKGTTWAFTGGPHGGWDSGSAWAALDFAPPGNALGCIKSDAWIVAAADGLIVRAENGAVVQDLDGDGFEQSGWSLLYMHVETRDRVQEGEQVKAGERIGHPSCEGGVSTGTHLHIARRYNGEWIPADQTQIPFIMDGWTSEGIGVEYDGILTRGGYSVEAWNGRSEENEIQR